MKSKVYVISGGPGTGKSTVLKELKERGYKVFLEAAREVGDHDPRFKGKAAKDTDTKKFQDAIFKLQKKQLESIKDKKIVFSDRGLGDTIVYYKFYNLQPPKELVEYAKKFRYSKVFILDFLNFYEKDSLRQETKKEQEKVQNSMISTYKKLGYKIIKVPFMSIEKRADFILSHLD